MSNENRQAKGQAQEEKAAVVRFGKGIAAAYGKEPENGSGCGVRRYFQGLEINESGFKSYY